MKETDITPKQFTEEYEQKKLDGLEGEPVDFCYSEIYEMLELYHQRKQKQQTAKRPWTTGME